MKSTVSVIVFMFLMLIMAITAIPQPSIDGFNVYYGNLHNHSHVSDGEGMPDEACNYAKKVAQLDFFGLSDHANLMNAAEWLLIKTSASLQNEYYVYSVLRYASWLKNVKCLKYKLILALSSFDF